LKSAWIPAFAGMTNGRIKSSFPEVIEKLHSNLQKIFGAFLPKIKSPKMWEKIID